MDKVAIKEKALLARVRRACKLEGTVLVKLRDDSPYCSTHGPYYVADDSGILVKGKTLGQLADDMGLLKPWETI